MEAVCLIQNIYKKKWFICNKSDKRDSPAKKNMSRIMSEKV